MNPDPLTPEDDEGLDLTDGAVVFAWRWLVVTITVLVGFILAAVAWRLTR